MRKRSASVELGFVQPQLAALVEQPPEGDAWIHEIKFDGYRTQFVIDRDKRVHAFTKTGIDWTRRYEPLAEAVRSLPATSAVLDGEVIVSDEKGKPSFSKLANTIRMSPERLCFVAFDLIYLDGRDLRAESLVERRKRLEDLVASGADNVAFSQTFEGSGADILKAVDRMGLEGIVSKRKDCSYRSGPSKTWHKAKCYEERVLEIIGVQREPGKPAMALMTDKGRYVGGAFITLPQGTRERLWERVQARAGGKAPAGIKEGKAEWIKPGLVARVRAMKGEEKLRHATVKSFEERG